MKQSSVYLTGLLVALAVVNSASFAQSSVDFGKNEYAASCASCHGVSAKGDGPVSKHLTKAPSDLTTVGCFRPSMHGK